MLAESATASNQAPAETAGPRDGCGPLGAGGGVPVEHASEVPLTQRVEVTLGGGVAAGRAPIDARRQQSIAIEELREVPLEFNFRVVPGESSLEDWSSLIQSIQRNYDYSLELLGSDGERLVIIPLYSATLESVPPRGYLDLSAPIGLSAPIPDPPEHASYRLLRGSDVVDGVPSTQAPLVVEILEPSAGAVIDSSNASIELVWQLCEEPAD